MENFFNTYKSKSGIKLNDAVSFNKSVIDDPSSGYGLYVNLEDSGLIDNIKTNSKETIELIRIPEKASFNIYTILAILEDASQYSNISQYQKTTNKTRQTFKVFSTTPGLKNILSETVILVYYFILLESMKSTHEIPTILENYLNEILLETYINNPITHPSLYLQYYKSYPTILANEIVVNELVTFFKKIFGDDIVIEKTVRQIYAAIISRVLEIPHEISKESQDYTTASTLIPILDFVNHSSELKSCVFDVDRSTNDIILKYHYPGNQKENIAEIFIQYSDIIEYVTLNITYGFIPIVPSNNQCFFNISIDREFLESRLRKFYKWLNVNPVIQLCSIDGGNTWCFNDTTSNWNGLLLPFMVNSQLNDTPCWEYNENAYKVLTYFHSNLENIEDTTELNELYYNKVQEVEGRNNDYILLPQVAWSLTFFDDNNNIVKKREAKDDAIVHLTKLGRDDYSKTISKFKYFFKDYCNWRISKLERIIPQSEEPDNAEQSFTGLCKNELYALKQLANSIDSRDNSKILFSKIATESNKSLDYVELPPPIMLFDYMPDKIEAESETDLIEPFNPQTYDQSKFTDFIELEQDQFYEYYS